jgi:TP901 family phage tail tape measure protein
MALNNLGLGFIFSAKDHASRTIDNISKSVTRLERANTIAQKVMQAGTAAMVASMASLAASKKLLDGVWFVANASGQFEQRVNLLGVSASATAEELKKLRAAALKAGTTTQFTPIEAVETLKQLAQQGLSASQSLRALTGTLDFASAAELTGARSASTLAAAIKVFSLKAEDAVAVSDKLMKLTISTAVEAHDLEVMLGTVSRGASITRQSLDEMLVSMGMVKNTGVDATVAASSVSTALLELTKNSDKLKSKLGVAVEDGAGKFRPFLDIVMEAAKALEKIESPTKRVSLIEDLSGRFGLTAFTAITTQLSEGIETATGQLVKGADAVKYLRDQIGNATGTTKQFKDAFLNSLPGQMSLLSGAFSTFTIVVGDAFARFLRPGVERLIEFVARLTEKFEALPEPVKQMIAVGVYATSGILILGSALLFVGGAIAVLAPMVPVAIAALKGLLVAAWPVLLIVAGLALVFIATKRAFDQNIGGFADRAMKIFNNVKLAFQGIAQFLQHGFIRGSVAKELAKKENEGILGFVRTVVGYIFRLKRFFSGVGEGFMAAVDTMGPAFDFLMSAFENLGEYLGIFSKEAADSIGSSDKWRKVGFAIGMFVGKVVEGTIWAIGTLAWLFNMTTQSFLTAWSFISMIVDGIVWAYTRIVDGFVDLVDGVSAAWNWLKMAFNIVTSAISMGVDKVVDFFSSMFKKVQDITSNAWNSVVDFFKGIKEKAMSVVDSLILKWETFAEKVSGVWDKVRGIYDNVAGKIGDLKKLFSGDIIAKVEANTVQSPRTIVAANADTYLPTVGGNRGVPNTTGLPPAYVTNNNLAYEAPQLAVPVPKAQKQGLSREDVQIAMQNAWAAHARNNPKKPESVAVLLDGEKVGQLVRGRERNRAANSFAEGEWGEG